MTRGSEFREYENGVADILASVVGEAGSVRRNVRLPSRSGARARQIDVLVEGDVFGLTNARIVVDCKRWKSAVDIAAAEAFIGLVEDVGAELGILVSAQGASEGAVKRMRDARGLRIKALSLHELGQWRPAGTVYEVIAIPRSGVEKAAGGLREAGFRVYVNELDGDEAELTVSRHHGTQHPSGEIQRVQYELSREVLNGLNISRRMVRSGASIGGGTPNHRWIRLRLTEGSLVKVLASTEAEVLDQVSALASNLGVPIDAITIERPDGWPFSNAAFL